MFGSIFNDYWPVATMSGLFADWKMSGTYYDDYALSRVGSPITITSVYHDCSGDGGNIYWPIFGFKWDYGTQCGVFGDNDTAMSSPAATIGSQI